MRGSPKPLSGRVRSALRVAGAAALLACAGAGAAAAGPPAATVGTRASGLSAPLALRAEQSNAAPFARSAQAPQGLGPGQIRSAYALPARGARQQTIAIVSAWDDPGAQADLTAYSKRFGLPACTVANKCFHKVNQTGSASPLPPADPTGGMWLTESALGIEVAHGVCQSCSIMLVEAKTDTEVDIAQAVSEAAAGGATVIATAYTAPEEPTDPDYSSIFTGPGAAVVAAAGDLGYSGAANFPASLPDVLAAGGTQLLYGPRGHLDGEQAWLQSTSGCSLYEAPPAWQKPILAAAGCGTHRPVVDLAAVADPGAIVHITGVTNASGGPWYVASGTSLSAPIIAGVIGLAGSAGSREAQMLYQRAQSDPGAFADIRKGVSAQGCQVTICRAGPGWDGPTGLGTPSGLEAFLPGGAALSSRHPGVTVSAPGGALRPSRHWTVGLRVANQNPFRVSGSIVLQRTLRVGGRLQRVNLATGSFKLGSLAAATHTLTITPRYRSLLRRLGRLTAYVRLGAKAATGATVTVTAKLQLNAPAG